VAPYLVDRYSERRESAEELTKRVNQRSIGQFVTNQTGIKARDEPAGHHAFYGPVGVRLRVVGLAGP
jgi:hypothetical protein